jgi:hypothetical protein
MKNLINIAIVSLTLLISNYACIWLWTDLLMPLRRWHTSLQDYIAPLQALAQLLFNVLKKQGQKVRHQFKGDTNPIFNLGHDIPLFQCGSVVLFVISIEPILKIRQGVIANKQC